MSTPWSTLPHQLRMAGIAVLAGWTIVLSWRVLTEGFVSRWSGRMRIEIVAFPQSGMLARPGTVELMEESLRRGAEVVGLCLGTYVLAYAGLLDQHRAALTS